MFLFTLVPVNFTLSSKLRDGKRHVRIYCDPETCFLQHAPIGDENAGSYKKVKRIRIQVFSTAAITKLTKQDLNYVDPPRQVWANRRRQEGFSNCALFFSEKRLLRSIYEAPPQRSVRNSLGNTPYDTNEKKLLADNCVTCLFALSKERSIGLSFVLLQKGLEDEIAQKFTRSYSSAKNIFFVRDGMFLTHVGTVFCYYGKNTMH